MERVWLMFTETHFYPIGVSDKCRPEDHGELNPHVIRIEDAYGNTLWSRNHPSHPTTKAESNEFPGAGPHGD